MRYKQTVIGALWAVIQPFLTMVVFAIFFGNLARIPSEGVPYPIFAYCALIPWTYFCRRIDPGAPGHHHQYLFSKAGYPCGLMLSGLLVFSIAFVVLIGMMLFYGIMPTYAILAVPLLILLSMATALERKKGKNIVNS